MRPRTAADADRRRLTRTVEGEHWNALWGAAIDASGRKLAKATEEKVKIAMVNRKMGIEHALVSMLLAACLVWCLQVARLEGLMLIPQDPPWDLSFKNWKAQP